MSKQDENNARVQVLSNERGSSVIGTVQRFNYEELVKKCMADSKNRKNVPSTVDVPAVNCYEVFDREGKKLGNAQTWADISNFPTSHTFFWRGPNPQPILHA